MIDNISSQNLLQSTAYGTQAQETAAAQAVSTAATAQAATTHANTADYGSFASLLASQLATAATAKLNSSDDDDDDSDSSFDLFSFDDSSSLMTESLMTAALSGDDASLSSIFGEGTSTSDALLMLCMMLGSGSSDTEGGMNMMVASLAAALAKKITLRAGKPAP